MGYAGFASDQWYGLFVPAGTPAAIVRKIESDVQAATADSRLRGQMWQRGAEIRFLPAKAFGDMVRGDSQRWATIARLTGARAEGPSRMHRAGPGRGAPRARRWHPAW